MFFVVRFVCSASSAEHHIYRTGGSDRQRRNKNHDHDAGKITFSPWGVYFGLLSHFIHLEQESQNQVHEYIRLKPFMNPSYRHAMCNEAFGDTPFEETCRTMREAGYQGIEIAPFTLAPAPLEITPARRTELRETMRGEGIAFVGLHWLMVSPAGLHVTTPDADIRARGWRHIRELIDLCADLGEGGVMVFGSPKQRSTTAGASRAEATRNYVTGLREISSQAHDRGVTVLVEALPQSQSDVVQSLEEAAAIVDEIGSPAIRTMFDVHNAEDETASHLELLERYLPVIRHVHVNEMDGRYPGTGSYDFGALLRKLTELDYRGWVSLEVFDFKPSAAEIARASLHYLQEHE